MRGTSKAPPVRSEPKTQKRLRARFGVLAALMAVLALALPAGASALAPGEIEEFKGATEPSGIASGPDGNLWFADFGAQKIGRITPGGTITKYPAGEATLGGNPIGVAKGPDGNIWFTMGASGIGRIDPDEPASSIAEFSAGLQAAPNAFGITAGPDGNMWFTDIGTEQKIGRITMGGVITEFGTANGLSVASVLNSAITAGSDGNVWFADQGGSPKKIGKITPGGVITEYEVEKIADSIALGADGNVWFTQGAGSGEKGIAKISPSGTVTTYSAPIGFSLISLTPGPDGSVWALNNDSANEQQEVTIKADESLGGKYKLKFEGCETTGIAFNANTTTVKNALTALSCIGTSNVSVATGNGGAIGNLWTRKVTFTGKFTRINVSEMVCNGAELTGTNATCSVNTIGESRPQKLIRIKPSGAITQFDAKPTTLVQTLVGDGVLAAGSDGQSLWFTGGAPNFAIGVFGVPSNRGTLSLSKSGTGQGSVASKPKGIKCGNTCPTAVARIYKEQSVLLTAKAAVTAGSTFEGWEGCDSKTESATEGTCTIEKMSAAENVVAKFGGTKKAILNPKVLTLSKGGFGYGAVKASGLACEEACTSTKVEYTGGEGKKLPATVTLTQVPSVSSTFTGWEGCDSEPEGKCVVVTSSAKEVTANYALRPVETLTLNKEGTGQGSVASKPKGIKCGNTCPTATMATPQESKVILTAKAAVTAGSTFEGWSAGCEAETKSATEGTCTVKVESATTITAKFGGTKKALLNPKVLTVTKAGDGQGTVKASGLACEPACTTTQVEYTGGEGKKLPATVTLEAISAPGAKTVVWSGCESEPAGKCVVTMSEAKNVTAKFDELE